MSHIYGMIRSRDDNPLRNELIEALRFRTIPWAIILRFSGHTPSRPRVRATGAPRPCARATGALAPRALAPSCPCKTFCQMASATSTK